MKRIALFKAVLTEGSEPPFETLLTKENFQVISLKTLDFEYKNLQILKACLGEPQKYAGILFTSPRCVISVQKALDGELLHNEWNSKNNYGVGPTTVECARTNLRLVCRGAEAGNASNLAEIILSNSPPANLPFLYPKGNLARDTLKQNVKTHEVIVYETITSRTLEQELRSATDDFHVALDYAVFFSPSGVKAIAPYFTKLNNLQLKVIAIGPTTEAALKEHNIAVHGTPSKPSADSLIRLLRDFAHNSSI